MTGFDYFVLAVMFFSFLLGMFRGFAREVLSLLAWVAAFWVAKTFALQVLPLIPSSVPTYSLRIFASFLALFLLSLMVAKLITLSVSSMIRRLQLSGADRFLGGMFGLTRGILLVSLVVMLAGLTTVPRQTYWREAALSAPFETLVVFVKPWLPVELAKRIKF